MWFLQDWIEVSNNLDYRPWDKSKSPCPCGNCTFPNLVHHQALDSKGMGTCYVL